MCPGARLAEQDFGWLVSRLGSSLYLEQFLIHGVQSLPVRYRRRVPHLQCWRGVAGFRRGLAEFVSQPAACETHFFTQSSSLIRFAADCLFDRAHRVLVTDLGWPAYTATLHDMAFARRKSLHVVSLKDQVLHDGLDENDLIEQIVAAYQQRGCDAIFLSDITYLGVRLPLERILTRLDEDCRFSVVDGAQAFNQRPVDLSRLACDLYLAGSQKWLCSYHPLRMAFVGRQRNAEQIENIATGTDAKRDALFNFCRCLEGRPQIGLRRNGQCVGIDRRCRRSSANVSAGQPIVARSGTVSPKTRPSWLIGLPTATLCRSSAQSRFNPASCCSGIVTALTTRRPYNEPTSPRSVSSPAPLRAVCCVCRCRPSRFHCIRCPQSRVLSINCKPKKPDNGPGDRLQRPSYTSLTSSAASTTCESSKDDYNKEVTSGPARLADLIHPGCGIATSSPPPLPPVAKCVMRQGSRRAASRP